MVMRLGFIYRREAVANAQYRALFPMKALQLRGHQVLWGGCSEERIPADRLRQCDLVHVYRSCEPHVLELMDELRAAGVALNWDNDDDLTTLPKESPNYRELGGLIGMRDFAQQKRAIGRVDSVTTTSRALAQRYQGVGASNLTVIENYLPLEFLRGNRPRHEGLVIGWLAGIEHIVDAKRLGLVPVLADVLETHSDVRVVTVGVNLELDHERHERWSSVRLAGVTSTMRRFDIGLAPLADIPANRCRSSVKAKEYAAAGVPWLGSPVGEYAALGARQGGRLVADDQWREAIERLIRHPFERIVLATRGRRWAKHQTIERNVGAWERTFEEAIACARRGWPRDRPQRPAHA